MQKVFLRLLLLSLSVCMFSCQSNSLEDDVDILEPTGGTGKTYTMYLDATYPSFVGDDADGTTRAQNNSWENGDVIYISFTDGNTHKIGEGKYNSSTGKWTVKLDNGSLSERGLCSCSVYYLCDGTVSRTGDAISIDESTAVYADMYANYSVTQDEIVLSASLKSQTWRMAFKGEIGTEVTVQPESSIKYIDKIDMSQTGSSSIYYSNDKVVDLNVQSTGKTPYIYGVFDSNDNNSSTLSLTTNQFPYHRFSRSITHQSLKNGESGIVTLPTRTSNDDKWTSTVVEDIAILLSGQDFNSKIKTLAAGSDQSYLDFDYSIEFIVFEVNSSISNGTIISCPDSPREIFVNYSSTTKTITISTQADRINTPIDFSLAFNYLSVLIQINGFQNINTENTENLSWLFNQCRKLQSVDLSNKDTHNITDMSYMFSDCWSLQSLDISNFSTQNVSNMALMFEGCSSLQTMDVGNFDTRNVINMNSMFRGCTSLQTLDVSNFDTRNVTDMGSMFHYCSSLQTLDVGNFDTRNVTDMGSMFYRCTSLQTLDVGNFDTRNVTYMGIMFYNCSSLQALDVGNFDTRNVTSMGCMFYGCTSLQTLDVGNFDTHNVTEMSGMFSECSSLQTLDISNFDTRNVTEMGALFCDCSSLQTLNVSNFNTKSVENMTRMFDGCLALQSLNISNFDTRNVVSMEAMFSSCLQLKNLDLSGFQTKNVTTMSNMFENCQSLETLNLDGFSTESITWIGGMFYQCFALKQLYLGSSFILDKNASYDNYSLIVSGLAENSKECRISCPTVTKEFFLWMGIESKYIEWEILD